MRVRYAETPGVYLDTFTASAKANHTRSYVGLEPCRTYITEVELFQSGVLVDSVTLRLKLRKANATDLSRAETLRRSLQDIRTTSIAMGITLTQIISDLRSARADLQTALRSAPDPAPPNGSAVRRAQGHLDDFQNRVEVVIPALASELRARRETAINAARGATSLQATDTIATVGGTGIALISLSLFATGLVVLGTGVIATASVQTLGLSAVIAAFSTTAAPTFFAINIVQGLATVSVVGGVLAFVLLPASGIFLQYTANRQRNSVQSAIDELQRTVTLPGGGTRQVGLIPSAEEALVRFTTGDLSIAASDNAIEAVDVDIAEIRRQIARTVC